MIQKNKKCVSDSKIISEAENTKYFILKTKSTDWEQNVVNYLRYITDIDVIPLRYIIKRNEVLDPKISLEFFDMYG